MRAPRHRRAPRRSGSRACSAGRPGASAPRRPGCPRRAGSLSPSCRLSLSLSLPARGEGERECRALLHRALGPDLAAVAPDDALRAGETDPGPAELGRAVEALERAEELACVRHVEAGPVVPHEERGDAITAG